MEFVPATQALLAEKTDTAAASAQEKLNAVWDVIFALPVYRELKMDAESNYHTFERLLMDKEKWAQVQDPASEGHAIYQGMIAGLACFSSGLMGLRQQIRIMTEKYFEPLKRRNSGVYAEAYSTFCAQMLSVAAHLWSMTAPITG